MGAELATGTVTFLFTDLEGSTRLWEEHPEAMKRALARHDEILRDAVETPGGVVVKTTGDGLLAAFESAEGALLAAAAGQVALAAERWERTGPLRVRMGIHTGTGELRDGDYFGPALNRAARVTAVAHGGQVLVSLATEELVRDSLTSEVGLVELGEHRLRDLSRPERVFQLQVPGLACEFPALRSLDALPGNLPVQLTSFVGREEELARRPRGHRRARGRGRRPRAWVWARPSHPRSPRPRDRSPGHLTRCSAPARAVLPRHDHDRQRGRRLRRCRHHPQPRRRITLNDSRRGTSSPSVSPEGARIGARAVGERISPDLSASKDACRAPLCAHRVPIGCRSRRASDDSAFVDGRSGAGIAL